MESDPGRHCFGSKGVGVPRYAECFNMPATVKQDTRHMEVERGSFSVREDQRGKFDEEQTTTHVFH